MKELDQQAWTHTSQAAPDSIEIREASAVQRNTRCPTGFRLVTFRVGLPKTSQCRECGDNAGASALMTLHRTQEVTETLQTCWC